MKRYFSAKGDSGSVVRPNCADNRKGSDSSQASRQKFCPVYAIGMGSGGPGISKARSAPASSAPNSGRTGRSAWRNANADDGNVPFLHELGKNPEYRGPKRFMGCSPPGSIVGAHNGVPLSSFRRSTNSSARKGIPLGDGSVPVLDALGINPEYRGRKRSMRPMLLDLRLVLVKKSLRPQMSSNAGQSDQGVNNVYRLTICRMGQVPGWPRQLRL